ncbi:MAG: hypothetical protein K2X55_05530 [Burkholderiaceae bacterium]|nr:hypothetical protein [Burkholderiaceae bacterium]
MSNRNPTYPHAALFGVIGMSFIVIFLAGALESMGPDSAVDNGLIHALPGVFFIGVLLLVPLWYMFHHVGKKQYELGPSLHLAAGFSFHVAWPLAAMTLIFGFLSAPLVAYPAVAFSALVILASIGGILFVGGWLQWRLIKRQIS